MAFLSPVEVARLGIPRPELLAKLTALMDAFEKATGRKTYVSDRGGVRSTALQAEIHADSVAQGFRAAPAGSSPHEYGAAFDLHIVGIPDDAAANKRDPLYLQLAAIGESLGLKAGIRWSGKPDPYHFELDESLPVMREKWAAFQKKNCSLWCSSSSLRVSHSG